MKCSMSLRRAGISGGTANPIAVRTLQRKRLAGDGPPLREARRRGALSGAPTSTSGSSNAAGPRQATAAAAARRECSPQTASAPHHRLHGERGAGIGRGQRRRPDRQAANPKSASHPRRTDWRHRMAPAADITADRPHARAGIVPHADRRAATIRRDRSRCSAARWAGTAHPLDRRGGRADGRG